MDHGMPRMVPLEQEDKWNDKETFLHDNTPSSFANGNIPYFLELPDISGPHLNDTVRRRTRFMKFLMCFTSVIVRISLSWTPLAWRA
jgi:hypothetical protein